MADGQEPKELPKELLDRIGAVTNKRARFVLDNIVKNGLVTTEELNAAGYEHPPRAAQDAKDLGFRIKMIRVKHSNGKSIGAYVFDEGELEADKTGRRLLPKKERDALVREAGSKCQICGAELNLQVDHRIPYEVAGESQQGEDEPYQILDGSCNRKKSWDCEHCQNWLVFKNLDTCRTCYWASPEAYSHIAMKPERRADLVWIGDEVNSFERLKGEAARHQRSIPEQIKSMLDEDTKQKP
jgi:hypothetical protein